MLHAQSSDLVFQVAKIAAIPRKPPDGKSEIRLADQTGEILGVLGEKLVERRLFRRGFKVCLPECILVRFFARWDCPENVVSGACGSSRRGRYSARCGSGTPILSFCVRLCPDSPSVRVSG